MQDPESLGRRSPVANLVNQGRPRSRRAIQILAFAGMVAWFGGLFRIVGEGLSRLVESGSFGTVDTVGWISFGVGAVLTGVVLAALFPWYRRFFRQTRADAAARRGVPIETMPTVGQTLRRWAGALLIVGAATIALALILPGLAAAAVSVVIGLVLRLGAYVWAAIALGRTPGIT